MSLVKIPAAAVQLGISHKTIYNWVADEKLAMAKPGYVDIYEAQEVLLNQQSLRSQISYFMAQGTIRDAYGRFTAKAEEEGK